MTVLIDGTIQDVVGKNDDSTKFFFFKHYDDFVLSLVGTIKCLSVCFREIIFSTDDNWFVFRDFFRSNWKSSTGNQSEHDMGELQNTNIERLEYDKE